jgi:hypothetical protein
MTLVNFLVDNFIEKYNTVADIILRQLLEHFPEDKLSRRLHIVSPLFEEIVIVVDEKDIVLATIAVAETRPLEYNIIAWLHRENIKTYGDDK